MSFDIFLFCHKKGQPATGNRQAVQELLSRAQADGPDEYGTYLISFADGADVEFSADNLAGEAADDEDELVENPFGGPASPKSPPFFSCSFAVGGFSPQLADFIYETARAGGFSMEAAGGGELPTILVSESQAADVPSSQGGFAIVNSGADLLRLLDSGYEKWQAYRDQVVGGVTARPRASKTRASAAKRPVSRERPSKKLSTAKLAKRKAAAKPKFKSAKAAAKKRVAKKPAAKKRKQAGKQKTKR